MLGLRHVKISKWGWQLGRLTRKLWLRATLISLLAVGAALMSLLISPYLPIGLSAKIGADAVDRILNIIATSMLAVTTFSLSTMVAAYSAATTNVTPRATKLLIEDKTTLNVLATFVGSFLFSVVAIITLAMGAYGERGRVVLFAVTVLVVLLIVVTLLRWIDYLLRLGRVGETTEEVEEAVTAAMRARLKRPNLDGTPWDDPTSLPDNAQPVFSSRIGYVQHVDVGAVSSRAGEVGARVYLAALPGTFIDLKRPLAWIAGAKGDLDPSSIAAAFSVGEERSFDQDPRFGLCVLAEIASRALSPGLNDPGTAIDVIGRAVRVMSIWAEPMEEAPDPSYPNVYVPSIDVADLFDDLLTPIARDGASIAEVQIRLQKAYAALARMGDRRYRDNAVRHSKIALERAQSAMSSRHDVDRVRAAAKLVGAESKGKARRAKPAAGKKR
ncbi:MAG: DUF2254 domain-containing protein [Rhizobiaceae bacterium]|nr:DUF2254 domain-containing protein [Rhizobiaceae bacterium]